ncbi:MAG: N-acetyltransferase [Lactobacillaceae bacterium]|jgi:predicted GNAT family acetyltransferase|nr:N-acetyltransferase [Lactobacillaceae bacterium]
MEFIRETGRLYHENAAGDMDAEILFPAIENDTVWSIDATYVSPGLRGQGIAGQLLAEVVALAKQENKQLRPICKYAKEKFFRTPEYQALEWHNQ